MLNLLFKKCTVLCICIVASTLSFADCADVLRANLILQSGKKLDYLNSSISEVNLENRSVEFQGKFDKLFKGTQDQKNNEIFEIIIKKTFPENDVKEALYTIRKNWHDSLMVREWLENLYSDFVSEIYIESTPENIGKFESSLRIPESLAFRVLKDRSKTGGFSQEILVLKEGHSSKRFLQALREKSLIVDRSVSGSYYLPLRNMMYVDFMIFSLQKSGINPEVSSKLYSWLGTDIAIYSVDYNVYLNPVSVWHLLFNSSHAGISNPETLSPILNQYFDFNYLR